MQEFTVPVANSRVKVCDITYTYPHKQKGMYFGCSFSSEHILDEIVTVNNFDSVLIALKWNGKKDKKYLGFFHRENFKEFKESSEWS